MASESEALLEALVALHGAMKRQGPGDDALTRRLIERLPRLPGKPRVADLGCGTGASAFVLAEMLGVPIDCVDASADFVAILEARAAALGLGHLIRGRVGDMATYRHPDGPLNLLWSEGAAYHLTFPGALSTWRPILNPGGFAVISELTWFKTDRPTNVEAFWAATYPQLADEATNIVTAQASGFEVLFTERLPSNAWRENYYGPLSARADELSAEASEAMRGVIEETRREIALFEEADESFGYTFYGLKAV
ncbi:SAM-dependent methyltransferase [Antarcticirhabdus aurantiaca]|uniref:Class I SAM-dependent methyltransferase n=1 Tax=Antarcticirhabdus aurantiaca TaxID=2606717 RepID=A0ACD4NU72_9HYPH|nr:class I SAM-dependent methyltransferase [Antarcticirhabdus aurantiaca]WAJ30102.1 class I SAM-dependent methyltransferase [Jeongeuplla avenae]